MAELGFDGGDGAVEIDGAAGVADDEGGQTEASCVESGVADAVVVSEAGEEDAVEVAFAEIAGEAGRRGAVVLKKCRVRVDGAAKAFAQDELGLREMQGGVKLGAVGTLKAVIGP